MTAKELEQYNAFLTETHERAKQIDSKLDKTDSEIRAEVSSIIQQLGSIRKY